MTRLTEEEKKKLVTGTEVTTTEAYSLLEAPSGSRPRIYGYLHQGPAAGQIVALKSNHYLEKYKDDLDLVWVSGTQTIYDLIKQR